MQSKWRSLEAARAPPRTSRGDDLDVVPPPISSMIELRCVSSSSTMSRRRAPARGTRRCSRSILELVLADRLVQDRDRAGAQRLLRCRSRRCPRRRAPGCGGLRVRFRCSSTCQPSCTGSWTSRMIASGWYSCASATAEVTPGRDDALEPALPSELELGLRELDVVLDDQDDAVALARSCARSSSTSLVRAAARGRTRGRCSGRSRLRRGLLAPRTAAARADGRQVERERRCRRRARDSTWISPPSSRAISREIDSPRPVPPYLRLVVPSACWNASKISLQLVLRDADAGVGDRERDDALGLGEASRREARCRRRPADRRA